MLFYFIFCRNFVNFYHFTTNLFHFPPIWCTLFPYSKQASKTCPLGLRFSFNPFLFIFFAVFQN